MGKQKHTRKLVCHLGKMKAHQLTGVQIHHQREKESKTNPDIDKSRSHLNYDLHNEKPIQFLRTAKRKIEEKAPKARMRKDSNFVIEAELSAGQLFWQDASKQEQERFFKEAYNFMAEKIGKQNIVYAIVHHDEKTPHMHFGFCPITKDGRLNAKDVIMERKKMGRIHQNFYKQMKDRGFKIERGEPAKEKHIEPQRWKVQQLEKEAYKLKSLLDKGIKFVGDLRKEKQKLEKQLKPLQQIQKTAAQIKEMPAESVLFNKNQVKVDRDDWKMLKDQASQVDYLSKENERLQKENGLLWKRVDDFGIEVESMRQKVEVFQELSEKYQKLKGYAKNLESKLGIVKDELEKEFDLELEQNTIDMGEL